MTDCIFCKILAGTLPGSFLYRDEQVVAFMDVQPVNPGHVLVIPVAHAAYLADLRPADGERMFRVGQEIAAALRHSDLGCEGVNLFLADGVAAGQEVFHAHLHVFPRFKDDGFGLKHGPNYRNLPPREDLDRIAAQLRTTIERSATKEPPEPPRKR